MLALLSLLLNSDIWDQMDGVLYRPPWGTSKSLAFVMMMFIEFFLSVLMILMEFFLSEDVELRLILTEFVCAELNILME